MSTASPILSGGFARAYWVTLRPYLSFVSGATGLVGLARSGPLSPTRFIIIGSVFFVAYGLGQALTDVTQLDTDAISAPYRPMVRGLLRPRDVLVVSLVGLASCAAVLVLFNPVITLFAIWPVIGLATYTPMKRRVWAGPIWNAWIVATIPLLAALAGGRGARDALTDTPLRNAMATTFFAYLTFVLLGYLKDTEADRKTGYETLPVRFGRRATVLVSLACGAIAVALSVPPPGGSAVWIWSFGAFTLLLAHGLAWRVKTDRAAHPAIAMGLRGYIALHLGEAIAFRPTLLWPGVALLVVFEAALARRPMKEQV